MTPDGVILDAEHTLETPASLWLSTGLRALDHSIESLYRPYVPPLIHALAYASIADLFKYLPISKRDPKDVNARQKLQIAAWHSLFPYRQEDNAKSALGLSHGLGYMLGSPYNIGHGMTSCIALGPVVRYQSTHATQPQKERLARVLSVIGETSSGDTDRDVAAVADAIDGLVKTLGLDQGLLELGLPSKDELETVCAGIGLKGGDKEQMISLLQSKL